MFKEMFMVVREQFSFIQSGILSWKPWIRFNRYNMVISCNLWYRNYFISIPILTYYRQSFVNFVKDGGNWQIVHVVTTIVHELSQRTILIWTIFHFMEIIHQMWQSFAKVDGRSWYNSSEKLIFTVRIYETFEFYARQIVRCWQPFDIFAMFLKMMSIQYMNTNSLRRAFFLIWLSQVYLLILLDTFTHSFYI